MEVCVGGGAQRCVCGCWVGGTGKGVSKATIELRIFTALLLLLLENPAASPVPPPPAAPRAPRLASSELRPEGPTTNRRVLRRARDVRESVQESPTYGVCSTRA